jgi:hypothetical protein
LTDKKITKKKSQSGLTAKIDIFRQFLPSLKTRGKKTTGKLGKMVRYYYSGLKKQQNEVGGYAFQGRLVSLDVKKQKNAYFFSFYKFSKKIFFTFGDIWRPTALVMCIFFDSVI